VPSVETDPTNAIDDYGVNKAKIERWLLQQARRDRFPATSFRPGHIVGEGWVPINPQANANPDVFSQIARGEELVLPNLGLEMVHHVHADDVAQWIISAIEQRAASIGEVFNTVSTRALTLRGYAEAMYRWFEQEPRLSFAPFDQWKLGLTEADAHSSWGHIMRSSCVSIEKSRERLGYRPRFSSLESIQQSVKALIASGRVTVPKVAVKA
jgi:nucleoside-diphosphate-sugar epimerase